jgi:hypothetical protein
MSSSGDRIPEEEARAIWLRAAQLHAEAERRAEDRARHLPVRIEGDDAESEGFHADEIRAVAEQAGISPEFVQIALAEAAASSRPALAEARWDELGSKMFLAASRRTIELSATVEGSVGAVSAAGLQAFSGLPCLLQAGEVADLSSTSGRVVVFNVPKYDWSVTANPPFVEKAYMVGLKQIHMAIRPLTPTTCEVVVAGDLEPGMRSRWRWGAATSAGAGAFGGVAGAGVAASAFNGALLLFLPALVPALMGVGVGIGGAAAVWAMTYRYYRSQVEQSLKETLELLPATVRAAEHQLGRGTDDKKLLR